MKAIDQEQAKIDIEIIEDDVATHGPAVALVYRSSGGGFALAKWKRHSKREHCLYIQTQWMEDEQSACMFLEV